MAETAHTPGPFFYTGWADFAICTTKNGETVRIGRAECKGDFGDEEPEANAALFTASAEMLEVLTRCEEYFKKRAYADNLEGAVCSQRGNGDASGRTRRDRESKHNVLIHRRSTIPRIVTG